MSLGPAVLLTLRSIKFGLLCPGPSHPHGKNPFPFVYTALLLPLLLGPVVEDEQEAFFESEAVKVVGQLVEAGFVGGLAVPKFTLMT